MLDSDLCKAEPGASISLPEFNHEELDTFLEFLYQGDLVIEKFEKHFGSLLIAADKYGIPHLQKFCEKRLLKLLNSSNALKVLEISEVYIVQYKDIVLVPSFDEFAKQNPHLVVQITRASLTYSNEKRI
ncbi:hypothetical protein MKW98_026667 [Papaver atlanticum]|uniref:BTB domain-containing protein n=1 Tax=Papaver atlanticum TaxID=357466 RepID=A0AAD4X5D1_9MAGN|nr:hypothetical protein MKW98_026667 [Papaver atlanticum]